MTLPTLVESPALVVFVAGPAAHVEDRRHAPQFGGERRGALVRESGFGATALSTTSSSSGGTRGFDALGADGATVQRPARRQHLVEDGADRVDVGSVVGVLAARLLRRVVVAQPSRRIAACSNPRAPPARTPESCVPFRGDHDDSGLRPPWTKPAAWASATASASGSPSPPRGARSSAGRPSPRAATALEELEDEVDAPVVLAGVEQRGDVRMRQPDRAPRAFSSSGPGSRRRARSPAAAGGPRPSARPVSRARNSSPGPAGSSRSSRL